MTTTNQAYFAGRNDCWLENGYSNTFNEPALRQAYRRGYKDAAAELRLDADTEWDD